MLSSFPHDSTMLCYIHLMDTNKRHREDAECKNYSGEVGQSEKRCRECREVRLLTDFSPNKKNIDASRNICSICEHAKQQARYQRIEKHRKLWKDQEGLERKKQQEKIHHLAVRQAYEQRQHEREEWYRQQADRYCRACGQTLPATAFSGTFSANGFLLHTRCAVCHEQERKRHQLLCCLCGRTTARRDFLSSYDGYALCGDGTWLSLCCNGCAETFRALPMGQQANSIAARCQRAFPAGQVIYAEVEPETGTIRYVGRTGKPERRHAQHLSDASSEQVYWGAERKLWYTRGNWIHTLSEQGLKPSMRILRHIEVAPLVVEWERRYILHGIGQGWRLLNGEAMDEGLVAHVRRSSLNFLEAPFELLVQHGFFAEHGLIAFLHRWNSP